MAEKRVYEVMYVVKPDVAEDDVNTLNETLQGVIEKEGGSIVKLENMGRRKMAYEIKRFTEGHYVLFEIEGSGKEILELERRMRVNDAIIRFITVRVDEERKTADKISAKRDNRKSKQNGGSRSAKSVEDELLTEKSEESEDNE
ncbi:MAG: 30S ribosomal protein S6 [Pyrinomonadaceae bacterium]